VKRVTGLKGYNTHLRSKWAQSTYVQKPWAMFVWSLQQVYHVVPKYFKTTFSPSSLRDAGSVTNSWFHSSFLTGILYSLMSIPLSHWSHLNTLKCLGVPKIHRIAVRGTYWVSVT
jgi:hypothetical protein